MMWGNQTCKRVSKEVDISKLSQETEIGEPTLVDIMDALISPERDMRDELPKPLLKKGLFQIRRFKAWYGIRGNDPQCC